MPLKDKPANRITADDIQALITNRIPEGRDLEYKEALPGGSDSEKKEFLADVSSFANASGGVLLFGIRESEGLPDEVAGVEEIDPDREILRLENLMRDSLDPGIPGASIAALNLDGDCVVLVRVPRSWIGPHMVTHRGSSRFYLC